MDQVIVYNWGEYIDPEIIDLFEEENPELMLYMKNLKPMKSCTRKFSPVRSPMMLSARQIT